ASGLRGPSALAASLVFSLSAVCACRLPAGYVTDPSGLVTDPSGFVVPAGFVVSAVAGVAVFCAGGGALLHPPITPAALRATNAFRAITNDRFFDLIFIILLLGPNLLAPQYIAADACRNTLHPLRSRLRKSTVRQATLSMISPAPSGYRPNSKLPTPNSIG